jgi:hypothetical protein
MTVDDAPWHWADASGNPVIIQGLAPGRHKILVQLANAIHQPMDQATVQITVTAAKPQTGRALAIGADITQSGSLQQPEG